MNIFITGLSRKALLLIFALILCAGTAFARIGAESPSWTVLVYINGNSESLLQRYNEESLEALEDHGFHKDIVVMVQISRGDDDARAVRYLMEEDGRKVLLDLGTTNMGDYRVLEDFITWGMTRYPGDHTAIIVKGHGVGHLGLMKDLVTGDRIYLSQLEELLGRVVERTGRKIDVFGFDSCHMANAETAYALRNSVRYMVASSEISYAPNWEYGRMLEEAGKRLSAGDLNPEEMAMIMARHTCNKWFTTISVIDCSGMDAFARKLKILSTALLASDISPGVYRDVSQLPGVQPEKILARGSQ